MTIQPVASHLADGDIYQKIQCTFKVDIPDMGHLDGGKERDVSH